MPEEILPGRTTLQALANVQSGTITPAYYMLACVTNPTALFCTAPASSVEGTSPL